MNASETVNKRTSEFKIVKFDDSTTKLAKARLMELAIDPVAEIKQLHKEFCELMNNSVKKAIRIGELLVAQKAKCKHGTWKTWLKENCEFSQATANDYVRCYVNRAKSDQNPNLTLTELKRPKRLKALKAKPKPLTVEMFIGTCTVQDPLPRWHVVNDVHTENQQTLVCTKCWVHTTGGTSPGHSDYWFYECRCEDSHRDAVLERKKRK